MKPVKLPDAVYVNTTQHLRQLAAQWAKQPMLAVDTESNSLYAYREQVCLIQISTAEADYIIDPLAIDDLQPLAPLMSDPQIEKIFHAAEYDLMCLKRDFNFTFRNIFDTMVAARICGQKTIGLGNLLLKYMGIELDKSHQRDDWGKRPLPADSLRYAQTDTHYLIQLRGQLKSELEAMGRWQEAAEVFAEQCHVTPPNLNFDPEGYWRIALPNSLSAREIAVLRELYLLREKLAERRNTPPFKIFGDKVLTAVATTMPRRIEDLEHMTGISSLQVQRYGRDVLKAVQRGEQSPLPAPPTPEPPADPVAVECYTALRDWRKERAQARGVESDVIISKETLWQLAQKRPTALEELQGVPGLGPWRLESYGQELLEVLSRFSQNGHRR
jgi:ribonuclease D